jgi:hypothetical protein
LVILHIENVPNGVYNKDTIKRKETKGKKKMSNQEIFEMLSENESKLFYAYLANPTNEMKTAHEAAKVAIETFAKVTGCHN